MLLIQVSNFKLYTMTYTEKFNIALTLEDSGITNSDLNDVLNAIYTGDHELLQTSLGWICDVLESLEISINAYDIKPIYRFLQSF